MRGPKLLPYRRLLLLLEWVVTPNETSMITARKPSLVIIAGQIGAAYIHAGG